MALKFMKTSGIAALAAGLAFVAIPSAASADPGDGNGHGRWQEKFENRGGGDENRGRAQREQAAPQQAQAPVAAPAPRNPGGDRGGTPGQGWGSQRPAEGQRYGRDWNGGGAINRPAPAFRNQAPEATQRVERNPTYADPNRNGGYNREAPRQQGWDGQRWNGQNGDQRTVDRNRDGRVDRDGDRNRNGGWDRNRGGNWGGDRGDGWRGDRGANWNRDWRHDNRYNWSGWRNSHRDVFRLGRYYSPYHNYSYRRLSIGFYLDSLFFGSNYWIADPWQYRLPPAYGPYRWVRYYDDALLVDIYSGEVVDVIYDVFW